MINQTFPNRCENSAKIRPDDKKKRDVKFYFNIKYINKASASGIRSMCTYSYTHPHNRGLKRYQAYDSPHTIKKQNDGSCSHLENMVRIYMWFGPMPELDTGHMITAAGFL